MTTARDRILGRLRVARPHDALPLPELDAHFAPRAAHEGLAQRSDRFQRAIEAAHAEVHRVTDAGLPHILARLLHEKRIRQVAVGQATLDNPALSGAFPASTSLLPFTDSMERIKPELFHQAEAGFTVARGAIAETGTLILWPGADEPRTLSLVPPIHIVLLDAATIHDSLYSAMRAESWNTGLPTNLVLVSGPSKTADIQQTLAYGAHGPKEVIVLLKGATE